MRRLVRFLCAVLVCASVGLPAHAGYTGLYVFGDSLSDSGNNALIFDQQFPPPGTARTPVPIPSQTFIPTLPYAGSDPKPPVPGDRYTNGFVWAELVAQALGQPLGGLASLAGGTNFAFGGATTGPFDAQAFPPSLETQVAGYLQATKGKADPNALYVVAGGGNDARAAIEAVQTDPGNLGTIVDGFAEQYKLNTKFMVDSLKSAGATQILVWNIPDVGKAPAIALSGGSVLGTLVSSSMNAAMESAVWNLSGVIPFDLFDLLANIVGNPPLGLNVINACAALTLCNPSSYLFWDGIHPTSAGHSIIAASVLQAMAVPEPSMLALLIVGGVLVLVPALRGRVAVNRGA
jgi:phospholipase/lecithinase/hemolysin